MSTLLSETLRKVIREYDVVVTRLAQMAEIDRTALQHIISGKRLPNKVQINKLLNVIPIPPHKKAMLREAYEITAYGPERFKQREKIKTVIEKIAFASMMTPTVAAPIPSVIVPSIAESEELHGILAINNVMLSLIVEEDEAVSFFMPPSFPFFYDTLFAKYMTSETLVVTCFFPMSNAPGNIIPDLEYCESFIPFFAPAKHNFQAYYMGEQSPLHDTSIIPFPYFVLTGRYVLLLSADMKHAILTKQEAFVRVYEKKCQALLSTSSPFYMSPPPGELITFFPQTPTKDTFAAIENQPCFQYYLNEQIINKYGIITTQEHVELAQKYTRHVKEMKNEPDLFSTFGQEGLDYFVETGYIVVLPPSLCKPLDVPDRIKLLERMLLDIKKDKFNCRMVDASKFTIPKSTVTIAVRRKTLFVQVLDYAGGNVKNICLTEKNIVEAFTDFFVNLPNTQLILSKEETVAAFEVALGKLRAKS